MAISVRLQHEDGKSECQEDVVMEFALSPGEQYLLLRYIDPYGDTIFNRVQVTDFLSDWERLGARLVGTEHEGAWSAIREFARTCLSGTHLYLRFIGD